MKEIVKQQINNTGSPKLIPPPCDDIYISFCPFNDFMINFCSIYHFFFSPVFDGMFDFCSMYTGASLEGAIKLNNNVSSY